MNTPVAVVHPDHLRLPAVPALPCEHEDAPLPLATLEATHSPRH